ncbi:MAG TPA: ATP-binding protein [Dissulfurispiraceae bacterium]|nr:ATP-binding protein [Dissulfurispiraceae bacterium]
MSSNKGSPQSSPHISDLPPIEALFAFYIHHYKVITFVFTFLLLAVFSVLGWISASAVRENVIEDFNSQQLVIARHAAAMIEGTVSDYRRELTLLSFSPAIQYSERVQMERRMGIVFTSFQEDGALEIRYVEASTGKTHLLDRNGARIVALSDMDRSYLDSAGRPSLRNKIQMSEISTQAMNARTATILTIWTPVWRVSVDDAHPVATNDFAGVVIFVIDATTLTERITGKLHSGKTGYTWVIDNKGIFLYHPELDFIGKNAMEARQEKNPAISFTRINEIQKEMILTGQEGKSWFISGWHRGQSGEMKKLIAYAPVKLSDANGGRHWSVAVVAPMSEVEGAIWDIQFRQLLMEGFAMLVTLLGGFTLVGLLVRWSKTIEHQVEEKTKELKKSELHCRSLIENAGDAIFTLNENGIFLSMNSFGSAFFRRDVSEIVGKRLEDFFSEDDVFMQRKLIARVFQTGSGDNITCRLEIEGAEKWLSINYTGLLDENARVFAVLGIAHDISERKALEQQMIHTEKLASVGTLAAGVAHEINNPLAVILGFTEMLLDQVPKDSEQHELLKTIERQGLNARRIVDNLLGFARFTEHKVIDVDINANLEAVLAVIGNNLAINKIELVRDLADNLPFVLGDPGELQQVFFNIVSNAVAIMKGRGGMFKVSTTTVPDTNQIEIRLTDTGPGIPKTIRTKIFDPFFTTKKVGEGTGLGLSISYGIVTKHDGTLSLETKTSDEAATTGTTFIIRLPGAKKK